MIKINSLQYNALRDPQVYRRVVGAAFRIQAIMAGSGPVQVTLSAEKGASLAQDDVQAPGTFSHELSFAQPGVRIVTITAHRGDQQQSQNIRLDVMAQAWVG